MHLRRVRLRKGTVELPSGGGWELPSPTPSILCPAQRWRPWACSCHRQPRAYGKGAGGAEGVRSPRVIANSKRGLGKSWWPRRGR